MVVLEKQSQQKSAARVGRAAELLFASWVLYRHNTWVSIMPDASSVDMLVLRQHKPDQDRPREIAVQIKTVYQRRGKTVVNLRKSDGSRYTDKEVDFVAAVDMERAIFWLLPIALACKYTGLQLDKRFSGYAYDWFDSHPVLGS